MKFEKRERKKKNSPGSALNHSSTISLASSILADDRAAGGEAVPVCGLPKAFSLRSAASWSTCVFE